MDEKKKIRFGGKTSVSHELRICDVQFLLFFYNLIRSLGSLERTYAPKLSLLSQLGKEIKESIVDCRRWLIDSNKVQRFDEWK